MDFSTDLTPEQIAFGEEVGAWLDENWPADMEPIRDAQKMTREQFLIRRDFARKLGEKGWLYPGYPREYGGGGLGPLSGMISRELAKRGEALPIVTDWTTLAAPAILAVGTDDQKRRFLPPMLTGNALTWQLMTEPDTGTDVANQQTNALRSSRDGEYFVINGAKTFVGGIHPPPDQFYLLTRSDLEAGRHENLSAFIVPADLPGVTIAPLDLFPLTTMGGACGPTGATMEAIKNSVFFDDVRVHESYLLGGENEGWQVTMATFAVEHGGGGRVMHNYMSERFFEQVRTNPNIVRRLQANPHLLEKVVDVYLYTQTERLLSLRNAGGQGKGYGGPHFAMYQKVFGSRYGADMAEVLGPYAFVDEGDWRLDDGIFEVGQRNSIAKAPGGTPEAMKIQIARALRIGR
ncbi:MAG: acyl-CoA dehydrogenase family protein [Dehalococcoidia bacterium]